MTNCQVSVLSPKVKLKLKKTKLRGLSPLANYTDRERRMSVKLVSTFAERGCHVVSTADPYGHNLGFLDRNRYFFPSSSSSVVLRR
jgi:hypothetical protein